MVQKRVFIIHGFQGHPDGGWKAWVAEQLRERGFEVHVPHMPNPDHPKREEWVLAMHDVIVEPRDTDVIVGHSLGTIATVRYLESLEPGERVGKVILIAGFYEDLGNEEIANFTDTPVDWNKVHAACSRFEVIHSDDDDAVPSRFAQRLANQLKVPIEMHQGFGHFSSSNGITELPLLLPKIY